MNICVIGAGSMGTAIALILDKSGHHVNLLTTKFDKPFVDAIQATRTHPSLGKWVPESILLNAPNDWSGAISQCEIVVIAVASSGVRDVIRTASEWMPDDGIWAIASKGWDPESATPLSKVASEVSENPVVVMVGPSLASELASGTPTALACASSDLIAARKVADAISAAPSVRAFITDDVAGVEIGSALKNVLAIAIGMCDGLFEAKDRPMTNTKAAIFSRGLVEMSRLAKASGGRQDTILGLAGAGDLFVTVLGGRNGRFGRLVGTGVSPRRALEEMETTVEGFDNTKEAIALADELNVDMPVVRMVHSVLFGDVSPEEAIDSLVLAPVEEEI